jgi:hypothetical protein
MRKFSRTLFFSMTAMLAAGAAEAPALAQVPVSPPAPGGTVLEQSSEYRFQLDLHVNPAALARLLPAGWDSNAATAGAAKDANLRLIFIDCVDISGPDNKLLGKGSNRLAYLAAPVRQSGGAATGQMIGQMILGGISEEATPDGFGAYLRAASASMARVASTADGAVRVSEDWNFTAAGGEHLQLHVKYVRGSANKAAGETKFYNPGNPTQYQVFKTEQATDITRNVSTAPPDRVMEFSFSAGGGKFMSLFDGSEKVLSWDSQPVYARTVIDP